MNKAKHLGHNYMILIESSQQFLKLRIGLFPQRKDFRISENFKNPFILIYFKV